MEIPQINMITNFEAGINHLQNPSSIASFLSNSGIEKLPQVYTIRFLKWGALVFAIFATLNSLIKRLVKFILIYVHTVKPAIEQIIDFREEDYDDDISLASSDDDDDISLASSSDEDEEDEEDEDCKSPKSNQSQWLGDEDFNIKGWFNQGQSAMRRSISGCWSDFNSGSSVVKLWDSFNFTLNFDEDIINRDSGDVVSIWNSSSDQDTNINGFTGRSWSVPPVVLTAELSRKGNGVVFSGHDSRMPRGFPAIFAEWDSPEGITVGDVRNVKLPLD